MAYCRPIITPAWLEEAVKCDTSNRMLPDPARYLPPVVDEHLGSVTVSFSPSFDRKQVFAGKTFFFLTKKQVSCIATYVSPMHAPTFILSSISSKVCASDRFLC